METQIKKCFHPLTQLKLRNGKIKYMKDIALGDVLINNSVVEAVMKIDNREKTPLFQIEREGVNSTDIFVTGSHLVFEKERNDFIKVEHYHKAILSEVKTDWFSCLITSNHEIQIGKEIFWDWEDHFIKTQPTMTMNWLTV